MSTATHQEAALRHGEDLYSKGELNGAFSAFRKVRWQYLAQSPARHIKTVMVRISASHTLFFASYQTSVYTQILCLHLIMSAIPSIHRHNHSFTGITCIPTKIGTQSVSHITNVLPRSSLQKRQDIGFPNGR